MLIPHQRVALGAILIFFVALSSFGQSAGWDFLKNDQFLQAKNNFEKVLLQNPQDEDALCGMLFVSEVLQDQQHYKKYANQLIEATWADEHFALFKHLYTGSPENILQQELDPSLLIKPTLSLADSFFLYLNFDKSLRTVQSVTQDLNWSVLGAFDNISGSGHVEQQPLEIESFKPERIYENENGLKMKWVQRYKRQPNGEVFFNENLAYLRNGTYYANTFITLPKDETIQLRIGRTTPMKIWLDDDLIFDNNDNIKYWWDGEIVELPLKKGMHRILVKSSTYVEEASKSELYLSFNDQFDEETLSPTMMGEYGSNYLVENNYTSRGNRSAGFALRITNKDGELIENMKSDFFGKNKTRTYEPKLIENFWVSSLKNKIEANPDDWKNYFLLTKLFLLLELGEEGEEYFYSILKEEQRGNHFFFKYLFAKLLAANDKGESAEALLSDVNLREIPVVAILVNHFQKMDAKNNVSNYHSKVKQILQYSPTHLTAVMAYLNWLTENGAEKEKREYIRNFLAKYPHSGYKDLFLKSLTNDKNDTAQFRPSTPQATERKGLLAIEKIKTSFNAYDYLNAIDYYKKKKNSKRVIKLYDDLIEKFPYRTYYLKEKGDYLMAQGLGKAAKKPYEAVLEIQPYNARVIEKIGDLFLQEGNETAALEQFEKSIELDRATLKGNFALQRMNKKIVSIKGVPTTASYFQNFTTAQVQADEDWKNKYPKDESLILMYNIQATLGLGNRLKYHQKLWIEILNPAGANYWTEADFSFLGELGSVKVIKANGSEVTPSRNWNLVVFQNLEPGDLIQIEGFSDGDMTREIPNEMYHMAWLSMEVPIYRSVFELILPKEKTLNYTCNKVDCTPEIRTEEDSKIYTWENFQTPKNEHEEAVLDNMDKFAWVMLSTQEDWQQVVKWYDRKTYRRLEANYEVKNQLAKIVNEEMSEEEKVQAVYNFLTTGITYSHVAFLNTNYVPKKPGQTICGGIGDCKDVASLMIAMLRELDIAADYVLVRTSDYTNHEPRPSVLAFDHVVVGYQLKGEKMRFVDLTTDYFSSEVLPKFDNNQWALLIKSNGRGLFRLPNDQLNNYKNFLKIETQAKVTEKRNLEMQVRMDAKGVVAGTWRETLNNKTTKKDHQAFLTENLTSAEFDHLKIKNFSFDHLQEIDENLGTDLELKAFHYLERVSNFQILQIPILHPITTRTAMFSEMRHNNLALGELFNIAPSEQLIELQIPSGYELLEIPKDISLENEFGKYELSFLRTHKGVEVQRKLIFKQHFISSEDYADFKAFYLKLLDADRTKLAIRNRATMVRQ